MDAGAINVLYGSANRLTATGNQQWLQGSAGGMIGVAEESDIFGFALAGGDFNNNGFDDLAIGAIGEDIGTIPDAGAVNVLYGSANRLTATGNQQFFQGSGGLVGTAEEGDFVGAALSTGDYDNDTFADLAIGAPFEDIGTLLDAGAINTLYGSTSTLTTTDAQQFFQGSGGVAGTAEEGDTFGTSLAYAVHRADAQHRRHRHAARHIARSGGQSQSFHRPQMNLTRPDSPESSPNLTWLDQLDRREQKIGGDLPNSGGSAMSLRVVVPAGLNPVNQSHRASGSPSVNGMRSLRSQCCAGAEIRGMAAGAGVLRTSPAGGGPAGAVCRLLVCSAVK